MTETTYRTTIIQDGEEARIQVCGDVDLFTAPELNAEIEKLIASGAKQLILDMGEVSYIDSSGVKILLAAHHALQDRGGSLCIKAYSHSVARVLELLGLEGMLEGEE